MSKQILLIEPEEEMRGLLFDKLTASGYAVVSPIDTYVGLECAQQHAMDLLLLSEHMPLMSGTAFMAALKQFAPVPPAIVFSRKITPQTRASFSPYTRCIFMRKPFQIDDLLDQIARLLNTE